LTGPSVIPASANDRGPDYLTAALHFAIRGRFLNDNERARFYAIARRYRSLAIAIRAGDAQAAASAISATAEHDPQAGIGNLSMGKIKPGQFLEHEDVMRLLRSEIERAGGQTAWAKMMGLNRPKLNKHLRGKYPQLNRKIIKALELRVVYVPVAIKSGQFLERVDVMRLLRSEIERAGGQVLWAKREGINRPDLSKMLGWIRPFNKSVINALKLRIVYTADLERVEEPPREKGRATKPRNSAGRRARRFGRGEAS
jgi:DNA-binding phage protein